MQRKLPVFYIEMTIWGEMNIDEFSVLPKILYNRFAEADGLCPQLSPIDDSKDMADRLRL